MTARSRIRRGFTLIEILLVILIIGMLATAAVLYLPSVGEGAKKDTTRIKLDQIVEALRMYNMQVGEYPSEDQGLKALLTMPSYDDDTKGKNWRGPYLKSNDALKDPWNHDLVYKLADVDNGSGTTIKTPHVYSLGPSGNDQSGEGDNIKNKDWESETANTK